MLCVLSRVLLTALQSDSKKQYRAPFGEFYFDLFGREQRKLVAFREAKSMSSKCFPQLGRPCDPREVGMCDGEKKKFIYIMWSSWYFQVGEMQ